MIKKEYKLYLISGKARHGKDTIGSFLKEFYEQDNKCAITCSYASYLKDYAKKITDWDGNEETKPRELLQQLGNLIRIDLGKSDMLIDRLNDDILIYANFFDAIIVTDVRLKKELQGLKRCYPAATSINVFRPNFDNGLTEKQKNHLTEIDLDDYNDYEYKIINEDLTDLKKKVRKIYREVEYNEKDV